MPDHRDFFKFIPWRCVQDPMNPIHKSYLIVSDNRYSTVIYKVATKIKCQQLVDDHNRELPLVKLLLLGGG